MKIKIKAVKNKYGNYDRYYTRRYTFLETFIDWVDHYFYAIMCVLICGLMVLIAKGVV